jgi:hypothetical protein
LAERNHQKLRNLNIPHSDIFYIRVAIREKLGIELSLKEVEDYLKELDLS